MGGPTDLHDLVRGYESRGDEASHAIALGLLDTERPMWLRTEFIPGHFTASGFVLSPDGTALLLVNHARLGRWLQPGGHIEPADATVEAAARREVAEETGVTALDRLGTTLLRIDAHPIPARAGEPAHTHVDLALGFRAGTDAIGPVQEVLDARWVPIDDLGAFDADEAVRRGADALVRLR